MTNSHKTKGDSLVSVIGVCCTSYKMRTQNLLYVLFESNDIVFVIFKEEIMSWSQSCKKLRINLVILSHYFHYQCVFILVTNRMSGRRMVVNPIILLHACILKH